MSILNATGDPSLSEAIGRRLLTPGGASAPGIAPEIFPCVVLENDRPEMQYLAGGQLWGRGTGAAAAGGAGTRTSVQLCNVRADMLCVVERVQLTVAGGNATIFITPYPIGVLPFGTASFGSPRDSRQRNSSGLLGQSTCQVVVDNTLAIASGVAVVSQPTSAEISTPFVLAPGSALYLCPSADNVGITACNLVWRERRINPSERP